VEFVRLELNGEQKAQECEARMLNRITKAGNKKINILKSAIKD
jgi:hypothetical protein